MNIQKHKLDNFAEISKNILTIDSSTEQLGVAIYNAKSGIIYYFAERIFRDHGSRLHPTIEELVKVSGVPISEIELIGVTRGPGSFTGVRIGMSAVKGFKRGLNIDYVSSSSLEAVAYGKILASEVITSDAITNEDKKNITATIKAHAGDVYRQDFKIGNDKTTSELVATSDPYMEKAKLDKNGEEEVTDFVNPIALVKLTFEKYGKKIDINNDKPEYVSKLAYKQA